MKPQFVVFENPSGHKVLINTEDIRFAHPYTRDVDKGVKESGVRIEFRSGGWLHIPGMTVDSLASVVNGDPY